MILDIANVMYDTNELPASEELWVLGIKGSLDEWQDQTLFDDVLRNGKLRFGNGSDGKNKDELVILYGDFGYGSPLTVTRIGDDVWTIEGDWAEVARQGKGNANFDVLGSGAIPFKVTYDGTP